jgi:probable phosphoglycerate mutase
MEGVDEGISLKDSQSKYYYEVIEAWKNGNIDLQIKGGESPIDVSTRLKKIIAIILSRKEEESILICTHGRILRILLCMLLNYDLKYMDLFIHQNVCLYTLIHTGSFFKLEQFCDIDHLIS